MIPSDAKSSKITQHRRDLALARIRATESRGRRERALHDGANSMTKTKESAQPEISSMRAKDGVQYAASTTKEDATSIQTGASQAGTSYPKPPATKYVNKAILSSKTKKSTLSARQKPTYYDAENPFEDRPKHREPYVSNAELPSMQARYRSDASTSKDRKDTGEQLLIGRSDTRQEVPSNSSSLEKRKNRHYKDDQKHSFNITDSSSNLSEGTQQALANLEAMMDRLRARSPQKERAPVAASTCVTTRGSVPHSIGKISRRSLSPSKERAIQRVSSAETPVNARGLPFFEGRRYLTNLHNSRQEEHPSVRKKVETSRPTNAILSCHSNDTKRVSSSDHASAEISKDLSLSKKHSSSSRKTMSTKPLDLSSTRENRMQKSLSPTKSKPASVSNRHTERIMSTGDTTVRFLQGVSVLVDVRDQDGEDASADWVEQLCRVGAHAVNKLPSEYETQHGRLSESIDCIVFKNGKPATLRWYRSQIQKGRDLPVVGTNWILHCIQEGARARESDFLVEVGKHPTFVKVGTCASKCYELMPSCSRSALLSLSEQEQMTKMEVHRHYVSVYIYISPRCSLRLGSIQRIAGQEEEYSKRTCTA